MLLASLIDVTTAFTINIYSNPLSVSCRPHGNLSGLSRHRERKRQGKGKGKATEAQGSSAGKKAGY